MAESLIGTVIDRRYRVDRKIGEGGMGAVYQGEHVTVGNRVAIKVLHPEYSQDQEVVRRLAQEARVAGTLGHKNIVQVFDFSQMGDGTHYLVMEFLEGETLADYLAREGPVAPKFIVPIALQVLDALAAAHGRGIIHRDLKPENVFLTTSADPTAHVKVLDFGISKIRTGTDDLHLTKTGTVLGTPYFMSPEQASGKKDTDARTDIYALGVILYQALTGKYPFVGETYNELIINIFSSDPPPPRSIRPDIPAEVEAMILRAMAKQREDRFASARDFGAALGSLIVDPSLKAVFGGMSRSALMRSAQRTALSSQPPPPPFTPVTSVPTSAPATDSLGMTGAVPRRRTGLWLGLAAAVAAVIGVVAYLGLRGGASSGGAAAIADASAGGDAASGATLAVAPADVSVDRDAGTTAAAEAGGPPGGAEAVGAAAETAAAQADAAALPGAEVVVVRVSVDPAEAEVRVDGAKVDNPYEGRFRRNGPDVKVEATARGYDPVVRFVRLDADQVVALTLQRRATTTGRRDAGPADTSAPPPPPPPPPPAPDAGHRPGIDTQNPFNRPGARDGAAPRIDPSNPFG